MKRDIFPDAYGIGPHIHRLAVWVASRAASTSTCRFSVETGLFIIETAMAELLSGKKPWPEPSCMDEFHRELRQPVIAAAASRKLRFSHGIAGKLINMYVKVAFLSRKNCREPLSAAWHPPIDGEMLNTLARLSGPDQALWRRLNKVRWTKFSSSDYEEAIEGLKRLLGEGEPLWMAEQYWGGFAGAWRK